MPRSGAAALEATLEVAFAVNVRGGAGRTGTAEREESAETAGTKGGARTSVMPGAADGVALEAMD